MAPHGLLDFEQGCATELEDQGRNPRTGYAYADRARFGRDWVSDAVAGRPEIGRPNSAGLLPEAIPRLAAHQFSDQAGVYACAHRRSPSCK